MKSTVIVATVLLSLAHSACGLPAAVTINGSGVANGLNAMVQQTLSHSVQGPDVSAMASVDTRAGAMDGDARAGNIVETTTSTGSGNGNGFSFCQGASCAVRSTSDGASALNAGSGSNTATVTVGGGAGAVISGASSSAGPDVSGSIYGVAGLYGAGSSGGSGVASVASESSATAGGSIGSNVLSATVDNGAVYAYGSSSGSA